MTKEVRKWLVVYTRPRLEKKVFGWLVQKGIEAYCPMNKVEKKWSDRVKSVEEPLFKSYVFVHVSEAEQASVRLTSGVLNFVYWLGKPAVVKPKEIDLIKRFLNEYSNVIVEPMDVQMDDVVMITAGALMEKEGRVIKRFGKKVAIEVASLGRRLVVQVGALKVVKKRQQSAGASHGKLKN